jgi:hypothetical protein
MSKIQGNGTIKGFSDTQLCFISNATASENILW